MTTERFQLAVVDSIPEKLKAQTLYVTTDGDVAGHLCACGCGREVITPLSPINWSITIGRRGPTLSPSIGNWAFPCRSHYFIRDGATEWARDMSNEAIAQGRRRDKARKQHYYAKLSGGQPPNAVPVLQHVKTSWAERLQAWWRRIFFD